MSELIRVVPEDLHVSAAKVDVHADELHLKHTAANGRIEAAQAGVPTGSAAALSAAVAKWQTDTTVLSATWWSMAWRCGVPQPGISVLTRTTLLTSRRWATRSALSTSGCSGLLR